MLGRKKSALSPAGAASPAPTPPSSIAADDTGRAPPSLIEFRPPTAPDRAGAPASLGDLRPAAQRSEARSPPYNRVVAVRRALAPFGSGLANGDGDAGIVAD